MPTTYEYCGFPTSLHEKLEKRITVRHVGLTQSEVLSLCHLMAPALSKARAFNVMSLSLGVEPDLGKWPPLRKKLNIISTTEQNLLFIFPYVATTY